MGLLFLSLPPFPRLTIAGAIEIFILAFLIYHILLILKATQSAPLLVWISLLTALYFLSEWGELRTVHGVLATIFPYIIFATIVLFQGEIRRGMVKLARNPFATRIASLEARQAFEDIVLALTRLASQRVGALVVLERETALRTYTESGIPLQAPLGYDLLVTVFQRGGPLHDGAVIIRKDKILAAACFLPLSMNPLWGTQLGTRHRAAIGITEETDAVAIAVSEESGAISLAVAGSIELDISSERLAERLSQIFGYPHTPGSAVPSHNVPLQEPAGSTRAPGASHHEPL